MPRKILVPVDLLDEDPRETRLAIDLARAIGGEIVLLHVVDYVPTMFPVELPGGYPMPQVDIVKDAAAKKLEGLASRMQGVPVTHVVEVGAAASQIVDYARREKVEHIVIGSHSRGALSRMVLGSVADRVAHTAPCPVTIVREPDYESKART